MKRETGCGCGHELSRREVLQAGIAATVAAMGGASEAGARSAAKTRVRSIDIHAHYFPQAYFDLFKIRASTRSSTQARKDSFSRPPRKRPGHCPPSSSI